MFSISSVRRSRHSYFNFSRETIKCGRKYDAILSTRIFDEGISCYRLDTLYPTCPGNLINLEQRIGRIQREHPTKKVPLVKDFWLTGAIVMTKQRNRLEWYKEQGYKISW